jgi:hypothetical protein
MLAQITDSEVNQMLRALEVRTDMRTAKKMCRVLEDLGYVDVRRLTPEQRAKYRRVVADAAAALLLSFPAVRAG